MNNLLKENERLDDLQLDNLELIQRKDGYKFSTDSVLLANFAKIRNNSIVADLCSGSGIVGILCALKNNLKKLYLVEMQPYMADMSQRSVDLNKIENVEVINKKIQDLEKENSKISSR